MAHHPDQLNLARRIAELDTLQGPSPIIDRYKLYSIQSYSNPNGREIVFRPEKNKVGTPGSVQVACEIILDETGNFQRLAERKSNHLRLSDNTPYPYNLRLWKTYFDHTYILDYAVLANDPDIAVPVSVKKQPLVPIGNITSLEPDEFLQFLENHPNQAPDNILVGATLYPILMGRGYKSGEPEQPRLTTWQFENQPLAGYSLGARIQDFAPYPGANFNWTHILTPGFHVDVAGISGNTATLHWSAKRDEFHSSNELTIKARVITDASGRFAGLEPSEETQVNRQQGENPYDYHMSVWIIHKEVPYLIWYTLHPKTNIATVIDVFNQNPENERGNFRLTHAASGELLRDMTGRIPNSINVPGTLDRLCFAHNTGSAKTLSADEIIAQPLVAA